MIRLADVLVNTTSKELLLKVVEDGTVGQSSAILQFEKRMEAWTGSRHCVAVSSGTIADTIALASLKHLRPGKDEVIVPALTFIAQVNSIYYNHLKPVFVDVNDSMQIDTELVRSKITDKTLCFFPVHLLGKPADMDNLMLLSMEYGIPVVEDSCEAMGSKYMGQKCGAIGDIGTYSFFPSHTMTTGEGGMILTNRDDINFLARKLRDHGKSESNLFHFDIIGFNGKMNSLEACIGIGMMDDLDANIERRRTAYFLLGGKENKDREFIVPHGFPVLFDSSVDRNASIETIRATSIECRNLFSSIPTQEKAYMYLGYLEGEFPKAEWFGDHGLYIPCHQGLSLSDLRIMQSVLSSLPRRAT